MWDADVSVTPAGGGKEGENRWAVAAVPTVASNDGDRPGQLALTQWWDLDRTDPTVGGDSSGSICCAIFETSHGRVIRALGSLRSHGFGRAVGTAGNYETSQCWALGPPENKEH